MRLIPHANPEFPETRRAGAGWLRFLAGLAAEIGPQDDAVELSFTGDAAIRELNRRWRGRDAATDVLSFHYGRQLPGVEGGDADPAGEIVVSVETARRQAAERGQGTEEELSLLVIHGLFHIIGMDHEDESEAERMAEAERPFRERLAARFRPSSGRS